MARELDVRGLSCPLPILRTRRMLDHMTAGEELVVLVTDPASVIDFRHFCNTTEHALVEYASADGVFTYRIRRGSRGVV
jgi:tRNA 2-thiouridine synthesizing protein A